MADPTLTLAAWLSPGYPVGAFSWSHGLEAAVRAGDVHDAGTLAAWIGALLRHGAGRTDAMLLAAAWRDPEDDAVSELAAALQPSRERRSESLEQGAAFARVTAAAWPANGQRLDPDETALPYPIAVGRAARAHDAPLQLAASLYLQAFAANLVSAAVRLVPLGQTDGQRALAALQPVCAEVAAEAVAAPLDDIGGFAPRADIASMTHETLQPRLFRS